MPKKLYMDFDCQAARIMTKFGGTRKLADAMTRLRRTKDPDCPATCPSSLYKWRMPKSLGGTDGLIPICTVHIVVGAARLEGILLTAEDFMPTPPPPQISPAQREKRKKKENQ